MLRGDTVYLFAWSRTKSRTVLKRIAPGFNLPVLPDGALDDDYPNRLHVAW
ncbi:hypothetical protein [Streptomyces phaeochromogenes]|uniref:hypothetical protein n=1 Tax=Streptomyces phaeochromogenes TaxID=1923 RepID=UPI0037222039